MLKLFSRKPCPVQLAPEPEPQRIAARVYADGSGELCAPELAQPVYSFAAPTFADARTWREQMTADDYASVDALIALINAEAPQGAEL